MKKKEQSAWNADSTHFYNRLLGLGNLKDARFTPKGVLWQTLKVVDDSQNNQGKSTNEIHSGTGHSIRQSVWKSVE
ncbi:hypothetical protein [Paenibacillus sp. TY11]|uniref:hypothetical protein n=1 Tax=Paenibacillus sp. TY11 TaxID=3448633 RepID=UPI0040398B40